MEQYNIKAVVKYSGINAHTLRAWERRYGVIKPARESNGRRMYSANEAERLKMLAALVSLGHAIGNLARLTDDELRGLYRRLVLNPSPEKPESGRSRSLKLVTTPEAISGSCQRVLDVLASFELEKLHHELLRAKAQHSARSFVLDVALPLVITVGERVQAGKMSIAQEHALSAILRAQLGEIIYSLRRGIDFESGEPDAGPKKDFKVTMAAQDGDLHEFGILMSAVLCAVYGVRCHYLGPNLPAQSLAEAATILGSDAVLVGRTAVLDRRMKGSEQLDYLRDLHRMLPSATRIWVGGALECDWSQVTSGDAAREVRYIRSLNEFDSWLQGLTRSEA
jgi:DNA-binding transcriptional MerR regulator